MGDEATPERTDLQEIQQKLNQIVDMTVDIVATFDDRFSYTPVTAEGVCTLRFQGTGKDQSLRLTATAYRNGSIHINGQVSHGSGQVVGQADKQIYAGPYDTTAIREQLSAHLATWYGELIRRPSV